MEQLIVFVLGGAVGGVALWFFMSSRIQAAADQARATVQVDLATTSERARLLEQEKDGLVAERQSLRLQADQWRNELDTARDDHAKSNERASRIPELEKKLIDAEVSLDSLRKQESALRESAGSVEAQLKAELHAERKQAEEKMTLLLEAKETLGNHFKSLANDILEDKSKRFTDQNQANISQLLNPLKERMVEFKAKVEEIHNKDTEQQATLKAELGQL